MNVISLILEPVSAAAPVFSPPVVFSVSLHKIPSSRLGHLWGCLALGGHFLCNRSVVDVSAITQVREKHLKKNDTCSAMAL